MNTKMLGGMVAAVLIFVSGVIAYEIYNQNHKADRECPCIKVK